MSPATWDWDTIIGLTLAISIYAAALLCICLCRCPDHRYVNPYLRPGPGQHPPTSPGADSSSTGSPRRRRNWRHGIVQRHFLFTSHDYLPIPENPTPVLEDEREGRSGAGTVAPAEVDPGTTSASPATGFAAVNKEEVGGSAQETVTNGVLAEVDDQTTVPELSPAAQLRRHDL